MIWLKMMSLQSVVDVCASIEKPLFSGQLRDLPKCPVNRRCQLNRGLFVKIVQCSLTINIQQLLWTVIKFHVVEEAKEAVLYFVEDFEVNFWQLNVLIYLY